MIISNENSGLTLFILINYFWPRMILISLIRTWTTKELFSKISIRIVKMKLRIITKIYAINPAIHFLKNWFYSQWSSQRPPASVEVKLWRKITGVNCQRTCTFSYFISNFCDWEIENLIRFMVDIQSMLSKSKKIVKWLKDTKSQIAKD